MPAMSDLLWRDSVRHTRHKLLSQIAAGEDSFLEFKELVFSGKRLKGPKRNVLADEIAAFSNAHGGRLVLGIEDRTREVVGIPIEKLDSVARLVNEICHDAIDPPVDAVIERIDLPDSSGDLRWVLVLKMESSLSVHRSPGGYFLRSGLSKRRMTQDQLGRLMQQRSRSRLIQFDETAVPGTWMSHLSPALVDRFRTSRTSDDLQTLALKLGMATKTENGRTNLTLAGVLLGTRSPQRWLPNAFIQATAYRGTSIGKAIDEPNYQIDAKDIFGPLDQQVEESCQFVARNQRVAARKVLGRQDRPQYDMTAIFEALVNAVAHRDYSLQRSKIRIRMFSDRLELYSPGDLVNAMTPDSMEYRQATRNEIITSLLSKCDVSRRISYVNTTRNTLMDRRGEGVPIILERSESLSGQVPVYDLIDGTELLLTIFSAE